MKRYLGVCLAIASSLTAALPAVPTHAGAQEVGTSAVSRTTFVRWVVTERRSSANSIQAAELILYSGGVPLDNLSTNGAIVVTNPGGSDPGGEGPAQGYDGNNGSKWLDFNFIPVGDGTVGESILVIQFPAAVTFDSYSWVTANDSIERDPVSWRLEVSSDGMTWTTIDTRSAVTVTTGRFATIGPFVFGGSGKDFGMSKSELATSGPRMNSNYVLTLQPPRTRGFGG